MFMRFNFVEVSTLQNFFNTEIFPIYGMHQFMSSCGQTITLISWTIISYEGLTDIAQLVPKRVCVCISQIPSKAVL